MPQPARKGSSIRLRIDGDEVDEVESGDYSSDVLALPDFCNVTISGLRKYRGKFQLGQSVELWMSNPAVQGGNWIKRFAGIVVKRNPQGRAKEGDVINLTIADRGWHLLGMAPLWFNLLQAKSLADLITQMLDPSFGIKDVVGGNLNNKLKQNVSTVRALQPQQDRTPIFHVQIEPGEDYLSVIRGYATRDNKLVNMGLDDKLQLWLPDYGRAPDYVIRNGMPDANVMSYDVTEDADKLFTEVECVGEQLFPERETDENDPNFTKKRGKVTHPGALPFRRALTFGDPEMTARGKAQAMAEWKYMRMLFDAWMGVYVLPEHFQVSDNGVGKFFESDAMIDLFDDIVGAYGRMYLRAVRCRFSKGEDDTAELVVHKPGLLSASINPDGSPSPNILSNQIVGQPVAEGTV
jgi:hypothetical protein